MQAKVVKYRATALQLQTVTYDHVPCPNFLLVVQVLTKVIKYGATALQLRATDVMLSAIQHDPAPLRSFMRSQKDHELFHLLVRSVSN